MSSLEALLRRVYFHSISFVHDTCIEEQRKLPYDLQSPLFRSGFGLRYTGTLQRYKLHMSI